MKFDRHVKLRHGINAIIYHYLMKPYGIGEQPLNCRLIIEDKQKFAENRRKLAIILWKEKRRLKLWVFPQGKIYPKLLPIPELKSPTIQSKQFKSTTKQPKLIPTKL